MITLYKKVTIIRFPRVVIIDRLDLPENGTLWAYSIHLYPLGTDAYYGHLLNVFV